MKKVKSAQPKKTVTRANGRIRSQRRNGYDVPAYWYWFPITPKKIRQAARKIVDALHPDKIILFGSFAYGKPTPDSDVDLFISNTAKLTLGNSPAAPCVGKTAARLPS